MELAKRDEKSSDMSDEGDTSKTEEDMDSFLNYGRYQATRVWVIGTLLALTGGLSYGHNIFILTDPPDPWWCDDPGVMKCNENITGRQSICEGGEVVFNTSHQNFFHSLLIEELWICNDHNLGPSVMSATLIGGIFNSLVFGYLSDVYGRKLIFSLTNILYIVLRLVMYHVSHYYTIFIVFSVLANTYFPIGVRVGYTLLSEICDEKGRKYNYIAGWVFWVVGMVLLPFMAQVIGHWYPFSLVVVLLNVVFIFCHPYLPESPRWLITQKRFSEAADLINDIRKINGFEVIANLEEKLEKSSPDVNSENGFKSLFNPSILRIMFYMSMIWVVNDYFYISGSLNVENLAGNLFVNFSLLSLTELPSVFIGQFLIDRFGRRWVHCVCMVLATAPLMLSILFVSSHDNLVVGLNIISKVASNVGWFIMWVQCVEIFPTSLRSTGITIASVVAALGAMTGPFVVDLGKFDLKYPYIVFSLVGIVGTIFTTLVPETKGGTISENVEDTIKMEKNFKFFSWRIWIDKKGQKKDKV